MKGLCNVSICFFSFFCRVINKSFDASHNSSCMKFILTLVDRKINLFELECLVLLWMLNEQRRWVQTNQMCYFGHLEAAGGMHMDRYHWHRVSGRPLKAILTGLYCWHKVHTQWHWFLWSEDEAASGKVKLMEGGRCGGRISHRRRRSWGRRPEVQDVCIICLETFSSSNSSAVTICKHTVHLQGILQWWAPAL